MIQGIFYARFLPQEGTKVVAQSPPGCIVATEYTPHLKPPLVDFDIVQEYIIPRKAFFNRFVIVNTPDGKYSILGFPVSIPHERYHRNEFIFNFGLVIESDVDHLPYERLVRRLAVTFAEMERQNGYLSSEGKVDDGRRPISSLLEIVKEDLNNYGECMIPVDEANTINMKLFPYHAPPAPVHGWHVPVPKTKLLDIVDSTWDLTLQRIIPHVDGVNDVRRIAWLADVSLPLTQCALQHLLYYDTILLLDMFFFGSCYAPRPGIHDFIANRAGMVDECAAYVCISPPVAPGTSSSTTAGAGGMGSENMTGSTASLNIPRTASLNSVSQHSAHDASTTPRPHLDTTSNTSRPTSSRLFPVPVSVSHYQLIKLMTTFCVGRSVMEWVRLHQESGFDVLRHVDVRRLVQFGVVKGLLYRVHKYVVSKSYLSLLATGRRPGIELGGKGKAVNKNIRSKKETKSTEDEGLEMKISRRMSHLNTHDKEQEKGEESGNGNGNIDDVKVEDEDDDEDDAQKMRRKMLRYVDGQHSFDQIITEQNLTDAEIMEKLKSFEPGDLAIFYR
ncbi:nitrogen permease regulator 2 [Xylariaceae sp. FL1651]|nr:nitrogen permease regulator 2 [Xylariaceae sp. FL1651]